MMKIPLGLACFLILCLSVSAADSIPPRIMEPPRIDGVLDEPVWKQALVVDDFLQRFPREGVTPTEGTEMLILYTETDLYLGFQAYDSHPEGIVATVMKRDDFDLVQNDQLAFAIDSYNDGRNGYWFSTNPLGARVDAQFGNEGDLWEENWNGIWNCKTRIHEKGWTAEIQIPFSTLRFRKGEETVMGINFFRRIIRTNEQIFAPLIPLQLSNGTPNVSAARKYRFRGIQGADNVFIKPYGLSGLTSSADNEAEADGGMDVRYQLTNNLISNFSLNMDFAEADVDDRQVNLTRFRLFFPEKRDFFLESTGNFLFGIPGETEVFFSRRIGLNEDGAEAVPILLGAKLTGKIDRTDIGVLNVETRSDSGVEAENFSVLRLKTGLAARSYIGGILTNRAGTAFSQSYGIDMNLHLGNEIFLSGFAAGAHTEESNDFPETAAMDIALSRGGERTSFALRYTDIGADFQPAIGFVQKQDIRRLAGDIYIPYYRREGALLRITPGYELIREEDHSGNPTFLVHEASIHFLLQSEDQFRFFVNKKTEDVPAAFPIFRDILISPGEYREYRVGLELSTKPGRRLSGSINTSGGEFFGGNRFELSPSAVWKINRHVTLSQTVSCNDIRLSEDDFTLFLTRTRIAYSLNTSLSASGVLQYDNSSQQFGMNFRAGYLFKEGTEFFFVYNEILDRRYDLPVPQKRDRSFLVKFTYLFRI